MRSTKPKSILMPAKPGSRFRPGFFLLLCLLLVCVLSVRAHDQTEKPKPQAAADFVWPEPAQPPAPIAAALAGIKAPALAAHIRFLASSALEGRGLGGPGLEAAAEYAAAALALAEIPPLSKDYFQAVPLREISNFSGRVTVGLGNGPSRRGRSFLSGVDCLFAGQAPRSLEAPVVFAGFGIREAKLGRDDYRGLDVRGAVVLILAGVPAGEPWREAGLVSRYASSDADERWEAKLETARALGAAAVLGVEDDEFATRDLAKEQAETRFFLAHDAPGSFEETLLVRVSGALADALLGAAGLNHDSAGTARPVKLPGVSVTINLTGTERLAAGRNALAVLAGADPKLRDEAIVIGAHIDHLGKTGGRLYPGADDNASGVSALIEIAKALAELEAKPKRSVVLAFWTGEEEGKLGSGYYVRHPLWPLARTVAYLNLDMIGHPWSLEEIQKLVANAALPEGQAFLAKVKPAEFVELGLPPGAAELDAALRRAARAAGLALHFDRTDGLYGGSDYRDFARAGLPFIRFFGNFFPAYHEPGDTADQLDAAQVERMARLALAAVWLLADQ